MRGNRNKWTSATPRMGQRVFQFLRHLFLEPARHAKNHAPMAAQKIGFPRRAAFRLEHRLVGLAEGTQTVVAGNDDPLRFRARPARIAGDDLADQFSIGLRVRQRQFGPKRRSQKTAGRRAPARSSDDNTWAADRPGKWSWRRWPDRIDISTPARAGRQTCRARIESAAQEFRSVDVMANDSA